MSAAPTTETTFVLSTFESREDNVPKSRETAWPAFVKALTKGHLPLDDKHHASLFSLAWFAADAPRSAEAVIAVAHGAFDIDDGTDAETLGYWLSDHEHVIVSTYRHTPEHPKLRCVVRYAEPIPGDAYDDVWRRINQHLFHGHVDPSTRDSSRMFYVPSCPPSAVDDTIAIHHAGRPLDWQALPPVPRPRPLKSTSRAGRGHTTDADQRRALAMLARWEQDLAAMTPESGRHNRLFELARAAGGLVANSLLSEDQVRDALTAACATNDLLATDPYDVERTLADGLARGAQAPWVPDDLPDSWAWQSRPRSRLNGAATAQPPAQHATTQPAAATFHRTDSGNGELFASIYGEQARYDHRRQRWLVWTERCWWQVDADAAVERLAKDTARTRLSEGTSIEDTAKRDDEVKWAMQSEAEPRLKAMLARARTERAIADNGQDWDRDPWLLGVANGVVDLRTGTLRDGQPADRLTQHSRVAYDPDASCDRWLRFQREIFGDDQELLDFIHRAVGYSLSGDTREQCAFLCWGSGANGKGTLMRALLAALGDYGYNMPFSVLELAGRSSIPNDVADLEGRRFVTASETNESARLNEARLKALTGQDAITARQLHQRFFTFVPVAKFWLSANHKPRVHDDSYAFWRRIRLIPFTRQFGGPDGLPIDPTLDASLAAEAPGILAWAIRGCLAWQERGLEPPTAVTDATASYRRESDQLAEFIEAACVVVPHASVQAGELYKTYCAWAGREGYAERDALTRTMFGRRMGERFDKGQDARKTATFYRGIGLQENPPHPPQSDRTVPTQKNPPNPPHPPQPDRSGSTPEQLPVPEGGSAVGLDERFDLDAVSLTSVSLTPSSDFLYAKKSEKPTATHRASQNPPQNPPQIDRPAVYAKNPPQPTAMLDVPPGPCRLCGRRVPHPDSVCSRFEARP